MPVAPTDPSLGYGTFPWGTRRAGEPGAGEQPAAEPSGAPPGTEAAAAAPAVRPEVVPAAPPPTYRAPPVSPLLSPYAAILRNFRSTGNLDSTPYNPARDSGTVKPFSGYRQAPAISPYLNLYRLDTEGNTIDNYYTLVKPSIEQRNSNIRVKGEIQGLQRATRIIGGETLRLQGTRNPSYYQNYGRYYPGLER